MGARRRLDAELVRRQLVASRAEAHAVVAAHRALVNGAVADKPARLVAAGDALTVTGPPARFVGRGGDKLEAALDHFDIDVSGRRALDVGASTGGFTDCLLQRGAAHVIALDVAYGELDWRIREHERVTVIERTNARSITPDDLPYAADLIVSDVSFISLTKVLPAVLATAGPTFDCLAMVKPQFEVGKDRIGKGGVVRDLDLRREAVRTVAASVDAAVMGSAPSALAGPSGNRETFLWLAEPGRPGAVEEVDAW